jgi:hypothetical protein
MDNRCATCAFRPGTEASRTETTVLMARLCLMSGETFECHERTAPCAGFLYALNARQPEPEWCQAVAGELLDLQLNEAHLMDWSEERIVAEIRGRLTALDDRFGEAANG